MITQETLREFLAYDPETGIFRWRRRYGRMSPGSIAGCNSKGYWVIRIKGTLHQAHRLAWLYVHGKWPEHEIDHINCKPNDNRIANLREATRAQNAWNIGIRRDNSSGTKGVVWDKFTRRWKAQIRTHGKSINLGRFDFKHLAAEAYAAAARASRKEFAR